MPKTVKAMASRARGATQGYLVASLAAGSSFWIVLIGIGLIRAV